MLRRNYRIYLIISVIALCTATMVRVPFVYSDNSNFTLPKVIIDGDPVPENLIIAQLRMNYLAYTSLHGTSNFPDYAKEKFNEILGQMVGRELLVREAKKNNFSVGDREFNLYLSENIKSFGGSEKVESFFDSVGLTMEQYRHLSRHAFTAKMFVNKIFAPVTITDQDIKSYYDENADSISGPITIHYSGVSVTFSEINPDSAILSDLNSRKANIRNNNDLKRFYSYSQRKYGNDVVVRQIYDQTIDSKRGGNIYDHGIMMTAGKTDFFEINKIKGKDRYFMFHLLKIDNRAGPGFEEIKNLIKQRLFRARQQEFLEIRVQELKKKASMKIIPQ